MPRSRAGRVTTIVRPAGVEHRWCVEMRTPVHASINNELCRSVTAARNSTVRRRRRGNDARHVGVMPSARVFTCRRPQSIVVTAVGDGRDGHTSASALAQDPGEHCPSRSCAAPPDPQLVVVSSGWSTQFGLLRPSAWRGKDRVGERGTGWKTYRRAGPRHPEMRAHRQRAAVAIAHPHHHAEDAGERRSAVD